tara:strand:+ start:2967 stop:3620 length:654 start_codon:yes stop_codon:yes gene_type:complete
VAFQREEPYIFISLLARWISGERSCEWAFWFQANWQDFERVESDFDFSVWKVDHTRLLRDTHKALNAEGYSVKIENQNWFRARHEGSPGIVIGGKPDLLALRDEDNIVLDVKTGKPHDWHAHQVLLPMALLPRSDIDEHFERRFRGRLVYHDGLVREFDRRQGEDVYDRLPYFLDILVGSEQDAHRVPSRQECGYCPISKAHCPDRVDVVPGAWDED